MSLKINQITIRREREKKYIYRKLMDIERIIIEITKCLRMLPNTSIICTTVNV